MMRRYPTRDEIIQREDDQNWTKEVIRDQLMSDMLQEQEDQMTTTNTNTHQNPTVWHDCCKGYDHAPWCAGYKEVNNPPRITYACPNCGKVDEHSDSCPSRPRTSEHQPAARGGGDGPERIWLQPGQALDPAECTLSHVGTERVTDSDIEYVHIDQHQALVAERDAGLRAIAYLICDGIVNSGKYYPPEMATWARDLMVNEQRVGIQLIREAIGINEQRSTSE